MNLRHSETTIRHMGEQPLPAPGWYPDPSGAPRQRYFDGHAWVEHYAPLAAESADARTNTTPERTLYSLNQITVAAFLGTPFAGSWLASRNLNALGQKRKSRRCHAWGAGLTVGNLVLAFILPEEFPGLIVIVLFAFATRLMAKHWFGPDLAAHVAAGGPLGSWRVSILAGLAGTVVTLALIFGLVVLLEGAI